MNPRTQADRSSPNSLSKRNRNRRRILQILAVLPFGGALVQLPGALSGILALPITEPPMWTKNGQSLIRIATAYLRQHPQWRQHSQLNGWISGLFESAGEQSATSILSKQIEADFQNGDYLLFDGWMIAFTEARLCAYLSMTDGLPA